MSLNTQRITPAWAGKSRKSSGATSSSRDHPRVGGEKIDSLPHRALYLGSPPRGRGKVVVLIRNREQHRITPAQAGKSAQCVNGDGHSRDHPRVGGEKKSLFHGLWPKRGSPPRGRGKDCAPLTGHITGRDHPRVGGEKLMYAALLKYRRGSPPRGRGKGLSWQ